MQMVKVTLLPELKEYPCGQSVENDPVAYKEWVIPKEAYLAICQSVEISTYKNVERLLKDKFKHEMSVSYVSYLIGKLERES